MSGAKKSRAFGFIFPPEIDTKAVQGRVGFTQADTNRSEFDRQA
jgi:hypothetical protein